MFSPKLGLKGGHVYTYDQYDRDEKGAGEMFISWLCSKISDGFNHPWRGASYMLFVMLMWHLCPTSSYFAQMFTVRDLRTASDLVDVNLATQEVSAIRSRMIGLASNGQYTPVQAVADKKRLLFYERRVPAGDIALEHLVLTTIKEQMLELERNPDPTTFANFQALSMGDKELSEIVRWRATTTEFSTIAPVFRYWIAWPTFWRTFLITFLYCLMCMKDRKLRVWYQLTAMFVPLALTCSFPVIGVWIFPTRDRAREAAYALRCASYALAFVISVFCASLAKAQSSGDTSIKKYASRDLTIDQPDANTILVGDNPPAAHAAAPPPSVTTVKLDVFGDATGSAGHDRQALGQVTFPNGFTLMEQTRQTADRLQTTTNITAGWKWSFFERHFSLLAAAGPQATYESRGQLSRVDRIPTFAITTMSTKWFQLTTINKMAFSLYQKVPFTDRHIQLIRGSPETCPRVLRGISLDTEEWHSNGRGYWREFFIGPSVNIGEVLRLPKASFIRSIYVYTYRDFCRHAHTWDVRLGYTKTFAFSN